MTRLIIITIGLQLLTYSVRSQTKDTTDWRLLTMDKFYSRFSPLDYLKILKTDFKRKDELNIHSMTSSPDDWVKEEHISRLMRLIYSNDSTKSIVNRLSSYLPIGKFSSIGREAQNLINTFRTKEHYPPLWSVGQPDKEKGKEIEDWWKNYRVRKP